MEKKRRRNEKKPKKTKPTNTNLTRHTLKKSFQKKI